MKAITVTEPGDADGASAAGYSLRDLPDPQIDPDQILVEVRAAGVNPPGSGPGNGDIPGWDLAGVVVATGANVEGFVVGDEVYACARSTYAERAAIAARDAAHKPAGLSFAEAAAIPLAGLTALQALRAAGTGEGDVVLVHDAAGGVGHFAVQIARALGAERVLGTAAEADHEFLRELGAEPVQQVPEPVDVALDLHGGAATESAVDEVKDPARAVSTAAGGERIAERGGRFLEPRPDAGDLRWLADLADQGRLRVNLHRELPLAEVADAHQLIESGLVRGKVVLTP
ncbi:NADP-dependent oxidoreductase [Dactylosporangium sp. AC04546]|uniref:NADP-dependent oxidoreductase n=1 Tax=Dactylosporangium sp. AC04546 TaxID=2862460 RepID=UPI001EDE44F4|nr:NADP-dependent oxidoreductase [Dactylosporangium sp. AC04546]WVK82872.1 NADP-dependent oxidoreductase [Dactylosporangium sp. AC04546]